MMKILFPITLVLSGTLAINYTPITSYDSLKYRGFSDRSRYGLRLLSWFVCTCLDKEMLDRCSPETGDFGFHPFLNYEQLLPVISDRQQHTYYIIGNLNAPNSDCLPPDVRRGYDHWNPVSNRDRLLVKYNNNNRRIEEIYISVDYDPFETYLMHPDLIKKLQSVHLCDFFDL